MFFAKRLSDRKTVSGTFFGMPQSLSVLRGAFAIVCGVGAIFPGIAYAEEIGSLRDIARFFSRVQDILDILIPLIITLAALVFFWGMVKFLATASDPKRREEGKALMIWGVIAIFVMISIWGFTELLASLFGINQGAAIVIPSVPSGNGGGFGGGGI